MAMHKSGGMKSGYGQSTGAAKRFMSSDGYPMYGYKGGSMMKKPMTKMSSNKRGMKKMKMSGYAS